MSDLKTIEGRPVVYLSDAIHDARATLAEMGEDGMDVSAAAVGIACEQLHAWETEARNMELRLRALVGHHRPLAMGETFVAPPAAIAQRVVRMTDAEIAARGAA